MYDSAQPQLVSPAGNITATEPRPLRPGCVYVWRRKRDSNPRVSHPTNGFQDRRLRPLGHSSTTHPSSPWQNTRREVGGAGGFACVVFA